MEQPDTSRASATALTNKRFFFASFLLLVSFLFLMSLSASSVQADPSPVFCEGATANFTCGDIITESCVFDGDMPCSASGLAVGASGISIDCAGYSLTGENTSNYGFYVDGYGDSAIMNCNISNFAQSGIFIIGSFNMTLTNNTVSNNQQSGIYVEGVTPPTSNHTITGNTVTGNCITGANNCAGISLYKEDNCLIQGNTIRDNNYYGILLRSSYNNRVDGNTITNSSTGGIVLSSSQSLNGGFNNITNNILSGNPIGIGVNTKDNLVLNNAISSVGGNWGIRLQVNGKGENNYLSGNDVSGYSYGLSVYGVDNFTVDNDTYRNNSYGAYLQNAGNGASAATIRNTQIHDNSEGMRLESSTATVENTDFNRNVNLIPETGLYVDSSSHVNLLNGDFVGNGAYGILDNGVSSVVWNVTETVYCTDNNIQLYGGSITLSQNGRIIRSNCSVTMWNGAEFAPYNFTPAISIRTLDPTTNVYLYENDAFNASYEVICGDDYNCSEVNVTLVPSSPGFTMEGALTFDTDSRACILDNFNDDMDSTILWSDLTTKVQSSNSDYTSNADWFTWERDGTQNMTQSYLPNRPGGIGDQARPVPMFASDHVVWFDWENNNIVWDDHTVSFSSVGIDGDLRNVMGNPYSNPYFITDGNTRINVGQAGGSNARLLTFDFSAGTVTSAAVSTFAPQGGNWWSTEEDAFGQVLFTVNDRVFYFNRYNSPYGYFALGGPIDDPNSQFDEYEVPGWSDPSQPGLDFFARVDNEGYLWFGDWGHDNGGYFNCYNDQYLGVIKTNIRYGVSGQASTEKLASNDPLAPIYADLNPKIVILGYGESAVVDFRLNATTPGTYNILGQANVNVDPEVFDITDAFSVKAYARGPPTPVAAYPPLAGYAHPGNVTMQYRCGDGIIDTIQLWSDISGTWSMDYVNSSYFDGTTLNYLAQDLENGTFTWAVWCNTSIGTSAWSANHTITVTQDLFECEDINAPGGYHLVADLTDSSSDTCININSDNVTLDCGGKALHGNGQDTGIYVSGYGGITIKDCVLDGFEYAIDVYDSSGISVLDNEITNSSGSGVYIGSEGVSGNHLIQGNTIEHNALDCSDGCGGIDLYYIDNAIIRDNTVSHNDYNGISLYNSGNNQILNNTLANNSNYGIRLASQDSDYGNNNTVDGNIFPDNRGTAIRVGSSSNSITNNIISGAVDYNNDENIGINLYSSHVAVTGNVLSGNEISGQAYGIRLSGVDQATISDHVFGNYYGILSASSGGSGTILVQNADVEENCMGILGVDYSTLLLNRTDVTGNDAAVIDFCNGFDRTGGLYVSVDSTANILDGTFSDNGLFAIWGELGSVVSWDAPDAASCTNNALYLAGDHTVAEAVNRTNRCPMLPDEAEYPCEEVLTENLTLTQPIVCEGEYAFGLSMQADNITLDCDRWGIVGSGNTNGVYASGYHGITVKDCDIQNFNYGINVERSNGSSFTGNHLLSNYQGIYVYDSDAARITGNIVKGGDYAGVFVQGEGVGSNHVITDNILEYNADDCSDGCAALQVYNEDNCTIEANTVSHNGFNGIGLTDSFNNRITGNMVSNNDHFGVRISGNEGGLNTVSGNTLLNNSDVGIRVGTSNNTFVNNTIVGDGTFDGWDWDENYGIYADNGWNSGEYNTYTGNDVSGYYYGMYLSEASVVTARGNRMHDNWYGLYLEDIGGEKALSTISDSTIEDNCEGAYVESSLVNISNTDFSRNGNRPQCVRTGMYVRYDAHVNLLNSNFVDNGEYAIYDDGGDSVDWTVDTTVACTNNNVQIYSGFVLPIGSGNIVRNNCSISVWNGTGYMVLNESKGVKGAAVFNVDTTATNNGTLGNKSKGVMLDIYTTAGTGGSITVTFYNQSPSGSGYYYSPLGKWLDIVPSQNIIDNLDYYILKMYYTDEEIAAAGLDENTLRVEYYNASSDSWIIYNPPEGDVNTAENYVWARINHFSMWGVFGQHATTPAPSGSNGGGGGTWMLYLNTTKNATAGNATKPAAPTTEQPATPPVAEKQTPPAESKAAPGTEVVRQPAAGSKSSASRGSAFFYLFIAVLAGLVLWAMFAGKKHKKHHPQHPM